MSDFSQLEMVHRLPPAALVDRFDYLRGLATGKRVVHIGFVDAGCQALNEQSGAWLHEHLAGAASRAGGPRPRRRRRGERARARLRGARRRLPRRRRDPRPRSRAGRRGGRRRGDRAPRRPRVLPRRRARARRARRRARGHHAQRHRPGERGRAAGQLRGEPPRPRRHVHLYHARRHAHPTPLAAVRARGLHPAGEERRHRHRVAGCSPPAPARCSAWSACSPGWVAPMRPTA